MPQASDDIRGATRATSDTVGQIRDKAVDQFDKVATKLEDTANMVADQGRQVSDQVHVVAGNFKSAVDKSIREQPLTTLALTAVTAFVLGALWKS